MKAIKIKCCGKLHEIIQFTYKGPIQYGAECSVCGRRVAAETPEALREKCEKTHMDNIAFGIFASIHPHEAYAAWPKRFWKFFQKKCPNITKADMKLLINQPKESP